MGHTQSCGAGGSFGFAGFGVCPHKKAGAQQANRQARREMPRCTEGGIPVFHGNADYAKATPMEAPTRFMYCLPSSYSSGVLRCSSMRGTCVERDATPLR